MATNEERLAALERDVAELKQARRIQEDRDVALLARIDGFIDDLRRIERVQMRSFEGLATRMNEGFATAHEDIGELALVAKNHKEALDSIMASQQQIIAILTGNPKTND